MSNFKKVVSVLIVTALLFSLTSCNVDNSDAGNEDESDITLASTSNDDATSGYASEMLDVERESIVVGKLSPEHEFYDEVVAFDPECANYITEISIYDKEIDDTFVIHLSLPPDYDSSKKYPMMVMTDGVWRLSDHPELRVFMKSGEVKPVILASIGYPNGYNYREIRGRDFIDDPESYLHFIVDNVVPYLSENYSVDSENMTLAGHSNGGFFNFYALFHSDTIGKNTFKNYLIGSPSLQVTTNGISMNDYEEEYFKRNKTLDCNVYVTVGACEECFFIDLITGFAVFLNDRDYEGLNLNYEIIEHEGHNTVFKPSIKNALFMFYGNDNN